MNLLDLVQLAGIRSQWVAGTAGGEYHSPCPECGGKDRFYIQPYKRMSKCLGSYRCRQCGIYGDSIEFARQFLNYSFQEAATVLNADISEKTLLNSISRSYNRSTDLKSPSNKWIVNATEITDQAHKYLLSNPDILDFLNHRGLPIDAVKKYKFGWLNEDLFFTRDVWGLEGSLNPKKLWIPRGLLIPNIEPSSQVTRLKVRRFDCEDLPKYIVVSGSMNGMTIKSSKHSFIIVVESELDAYAIDYAAGDTFCSIAVGSNIKNPDNLTDCYAKKAKKLFICHDNDEAGLKMLEKWQNLYPHAKPCSTPLGKDIGEAIQRGLDIKEWIYKFKK